MHKSLKNGSLWWDEDFETHFLSELERSQFPTDCKKRHVFSHRSHNAGNEPDELINMRLHDLNALIKFLYNIEILNTI